MGWNTLRTFSGASGFGIPQVQMAGPALQIHHDDALGFAPAGPARRCPLLGTRPQLAADWPSVMPSIPAPPTRNTSRRVMPTC